MINSIINFIKNFKIKYYFCGWFNCENHNSNKIKLSKSNEGIDVIETLNRNSSDISETMVCVDIN